jgi:hypothetical protein
MDISQFEVRIPSISDLNQHIAECIKKEVHKQMDAFLHRVAQGEDLSFDTLKEKYMKVQSHFSGDMDSNSAKDPKKKITDEEQCRARVSTGKRCSRRCKGKDTYCGGHINARPYGEL